MVAQSAQRTSETETAFWNQNAKFWNRNGIHRIHRIHRSRQWNNTDGI